MRKQIQIFYFHLYSNLEKKKILRRRKYNDEVCRHLRPTLQPATLLPHILQCYLALAFGCLDSLVYAY